MPTKPDDAPATVGRRERKRQTMRDLLAETAFRLFDAMGYDAVTMERIAEEADVARGTLYKHFPVKEALVAYQFRKEIEEGMAAIGPQLRRQSSFAARMKLLLGASAKWANSRRDYVPHYIRFRWMTANLGQSQSTEDPYSSGTYRILEALFREAQAAGHVRHDLAPARLAMTFEMMLSGAVMLWLNRPEVDLQQQYAFELDVLLKGVAKTPAEKPAEKSAAKSNRSPKKARQ
jgi:AcrR family transcriptional regulator